MILTVKEFILHNFLFNKNIQKKRIFQINLILRFIIVNPFFIIWFKNHFIFHINKIFVLQAKL